MKQYIRTQNGKIIETKKIYKMDFLEKYEKSECYNPDYVGWVLKDYFRKCEKGDKPKKLADTIEELIEVGDLVVGYKKSYLIYDIYGGLFDVDMFAINEKAITELYTKQGNDYILVAEKIDGKWRVI